MAVRETNLQPQEKPVTFEEAAKVVGRGRDWLRAECVRVGIAIPWGGTEEHPRYKVLVSEVWRLLLGRRNIPPSTARPVVVTQKLHPLVRC